MGEPFVSHERALATTRGEDCTMSSGIHQQERANIWARFFAGCVSHPDVNGVSEAATCADQMLVEYERRYQTIDTSFGAELLFGLPREEAQR